MLTDCTTDFYTASALLQPARKLHQLPVEEFDVIVSAGVAY